MGTAQLAVVRVLEVAGYATQHVPGIWRCRDADLQALGKLALYTDFAWNRIRMRAKVAAITYLGARR